MAMCAVRAELLEQLGARLAGRHEPRLAARGARAPPGHAQQVLDVHDAHDVVHVAVDHGVARAAGAQRERARLADGGLDRDRVHVRAGRHEAIRN